MRRALGGPGSLDQSVADLPGAGNPGKADGGRKVHEWPLRFIPTTRLCAGGSPSGSAG